MSCWRNDSANYLYTALQCLKYRSNSSRLITKYSLFCFRKDSTNNVYTELQCLHICLCLKFYFYFPFAPIHLFHIAQSLPSRFSCHFFLPLTSKSPFYLPLGGYHYKFILSIFSSLILQMGSYQIKCLYLIWSNIECLMFFFSLITFFFLNLNNSPI